MKERRLNVGVVLGAGDIPVKDRFMEIYKEEKRKVKRYIYQSEKEVNEQFGRKMNQDIEGNKKLFRKEVSKVNKGWNWRLVLRDDKVRRIWKGYFEDLCNVDTQEQVAVYMCGFDGIQGGNYFGGVPIWKTE